MTWKNTAEQNAIIEWKGTHLVVNAFAGTGKTTTLVSYAEANPESRMLYLAYNRAVRDEAERRFPYNVECKTSHQLAWARFGKHFRDRLTASLRITDVARKLNTRHWPLARLALSGLNMFLCSADPEPGLIHLPSEDDRHGLDAGKILGAIQILWYEMSRTDSVFPVTHDTYLKMFQLSQPDLSKRWDTILFDEAQDANPVTSAFVLNQPCRVTECAGHAEGKVVTVRRLRRSYAAVHDLCGQAGKRVYVSTRRGTRRAGRTECDVECGDFLVGAVLAPASSCDSGGGVA